MLMGLSLTMESGAVQLIVRLGTVAVRVQLPSHLLLGGGLAVPASRPAALIHRMHARPTTKCPFLSPGLLEVG